MITQFTFDLPSRDMTQEEFDLATAQLMVVWPTWNSEVNSTTTAINAYAVAATAAAQSASASAALAQAASTAIAWVSGTTYTAGLVRYSLINGQNYRRLTNGAGTTDPANDASNWAPTVPQTVPKSPKVADYTAVLADRGAHISFVGASAPRVLALSAFGSLGNGWWAYVSSGPYSVTIDPNGSELIAGSATLVLPPHTTVLVVGDSAAGDVLGQMDRFAGRIASPMAAATTINLDTTDGDVVHVTGGGSPLVTISTIVLSPGRRRIVVFDSAPVLAAGANVVLPYGQNFPTYPGCACEFIGEAGGVVRMGQNLTRPGEELVYHGSIAAGVTNFDLLSVFATAGSGLWARDATIYYNGLTCSATSDLQLQFVSSGAAVDTAAGFYSATNLGATASSTVTATNIPISLGNIAGAEVSGKVELFNVMSSGLKAGEGSSYHKTGSGFINNRTNFAYDRTTPISGFRLTRSAGNHQGGTVTVTTRRSA